MKPKGCDWGLRLALTLLLALAILPMGEGDRKFHFLTMAIGVLALGRARLGTPRSAALVPGLAVAAWAVLSLVWSPDPATGVTTLLWATALLTVAAATCAAGREGVLSAAWAMEVVAPPTLAFGLGQYLGIFARASWASPYRLAGPFVNSNLYAAFASVALLLALARLVAPSRRLSERVFAGLSLLLAAASLPLTVSRGSWLAVLVALLWFIRIRVPHATAKRLAVVSVVAALGAVAMIAAFRLPHASDAISQRLHGAGDYSINHRLGIYAATLDLLRARPFGVGLGGYPEAIRAFRVVSDRFEINFAHSEPLELGATVGIPAVVIGGIALCGLLVPGWGAAARDPRLQGSLAALLCIGVLSTYDFPLRKPLFALFAASVAGGIAGLVTRPRLLGRVWSIAPLLAAMLATTLWRGEDLRDRADTLREQGSLYAAARMYRDADRWLWPGDPRTARSAGATSARLARTPGLSLTFLPTATAWFELAHARSPWRGEVELARAALARAVGDSEAARRHTLRALAVNPRDGMIVTGVVRLANDLDDVHTAAIAALGGVANTPDRIRPEQAVILAQTAFFPAETIAAHAVPRGANAPELDQVLRARGELLAAELLGARRRGRWRHS